MSETPLLDRIGLDATQRERRLEFLDIRDEDSARLVALTPFIEAGAEEIVERFYEYILKFEEAAAYLQDPALVRRLKGAQRTHLIGLVTGPYDAAYFESRLRVGMAHATIRLEPQWYLGAYSVQLRHLIAMLFARSGADPGELEGYLVSLCKLVMLDIELATAAYIYGGFVEKSLADAHAREAERARTALAQFEEEQERREEMIRMVGHDIRSPVTAIISTARLGQRRYPDSAATPGKEFGLIEEAGGNLLGFIDEMLAVARTSGGQLPVAPRPFDLAELVTSCVDELRPFAEQSGHGVALDCPEVLPVTALDPTLVRRIVSNLLVNAVRHTPAGTHVRVEVEARDMRRIVRVADDGPGLPRAVAKRVLGDAETAPPATGLGLPFCRLACERLGGSIRVDASRGRGTCFVVDLPAD